MSTTPLVGWSPNDSQHVAGTREVSNATSPSFAWLVSQRLNKMPEQYHGEAIQKASVLDNFIAKCEKEGAAIRISELEAELEQINVDGEAAEAEFQKAKDRELIIRNAEEKRLTRYNNATRNLNNIKNEPLPTFHTNKHVTRKLERIANAQDELDAALADMNNNGYAIPNAVQVKITAETKLNTLAARARAIHRELSTLRGEDTHATGQQRSSIGL